MFQIYPKLDEILKSVLIFCWAVYNGIQMGFNRKSLDL